LHRCFRRERNIKLSPEISTAHTVIPCHSTKYRFRHHTVFGGRNASGSVILTRGVGVGVGVVEEASALSTDRSVSLQSWRFGQMSNSDERRCRVPSSAGSLLCLQVLLYSVVLYNQAIGLAGSRERKRLRGEIWSDYQQVRKMKDVRSRLSDLMYGKTSSLSPFPASRGKPVKPHFAVTVQYGTTSALSHLTPHLQRNVTPIFKVSTCSTMVGDPFFKGRRSALARTADHQPQPQPSSTNG